MTERKALEKIFSNSIGGQCDFPEPEQLVLPTENVHVTKKVQGKQGEPKRFRDDLKAMIKSGLLTEDEAKKWAKIG